jgi:tRNA A37 methylthiotransferase MiaB
LNFIKIADDGLTLGDFVKQSSSSSRTTTFDDNKNTRKTTTATTTTTATMDHHLCSFHIKTYGCQMNVSDSDIVRAVLLEQGIYQETNDKLTADMTAGILLTKTCAIRDKAEQKVWTRLRDLRSRKTKKKHKKQQHKQKQIVGLLGCMAERLQDWSPAALEARPTAISPGLSNAGFRNRIWRQYAALGGYPFVDLVEAVSDISPELRVRFTSPHPKDYPIELLHLILL